MTITIDKLQTHPDFLSAPDEIECNECELPAVGILYIWYEPDDIPSLWAMP